MFTVATPKNAQSDRLYAPAAMKKRDVTAERLLRIRGSSDVLPVVDGFGRRVKAVMHSLNIR